MPEIKAQIVYRDKFDSTGYTNENTLANALLTKPDQINPVITHLAGREDKKFPLTFLTEGQKGGYQTMKEVNDIQYEWPVISRMKNTDKIVSTTYSGNDKPGLNGTPFYITTESNWLKDQHTAVLNYFFHFYFLLLFQKKPAANFRSHRADHFS